MISKLLLIITLKISENDVLSLCLILFIQCMKKSLRLLMTWWIFLFGHNFLSKLLLAWNPMIRTKQWAKSRTDRVEEKGRQAHLQWGCLPNIPISLPCESVILLTSVLSANMKNKAAAKMLTSRKREEAIKGMGTQGSTGTIKGI